MVDDKSISLMNLLDEMTDLVALTHDSHPKYRIVHCSSYDRASVSPDEPEGWFANKDRGSFIRKENNQGREEHVIAEFGGPGCLNRLWTPDRRIPPRASMYAEETTIVRIYLDGSDTPVIEGLFQDVFNGKGIFPPPFAHESLSSAVSYFPVPFASGLKMTVEGEPFFYNVSARIYEPGTMVESFTVESMEALADEIRETGERLLNPPSAKGDTVVSDLQIKPGGEERITLPEGERAITDICMTVDVMNADALRGLVLRIAFDDQETVFCPLGDFFGCGPGLHPFASLTRRVSQNGQMQCRWVMPYQKSAAIRVLNLGSESHSCQIEVGTQLCTWDERSLYFYAGWHYTNPVPTRPFSDWNYVRVEGKGHYVGDTLTVYNPVDRWWGEGDEKIWVDDDTFPSIFGTGTEDYYGYSWGGQNRAFYEHPMHAQVRVDTYDKNWTDPVPEGRSTKGLSTQLRNLVLDAVTFESKLKFDMEVWHWEECDMAYAVACFWYATGKSSCNMPADPESIQRSLRDLNQFEGQG